MASSLHYKWILHEDVVVPSLDRQGPRRVVEMEWSKYMQPWDRLKRFFQGFKKRLVPNVKDQVPNIVKSRQDLLQVFDGLSDPVVVIDKQFVIQRVNRAILAALGEKSFEEFLGKTCYEVLHGLKQRCPKCTAPTTFFSHGKTLRTGFMEAKENPMGTTYSITCYPIANKEGEVISIAEYYRDSSDILNLTRELYESERARLMEPLVMGLAHQVRQPLTVIRSMAQYELETYKNLSGDFKETMESIIQNVDTINHVLTDLLHFSKPSQYQMKKGSVLELLGQGIRLVQQRIKEQKISVAKDWPQELPDILMNEKLLLQAYLNILINALESMTQGGRLTVKASYQGNTVPPQICIAIEDTGNGIPKELISKMCQPFFSTKKGGVGLGLAVAERVIRAHGGRIHFESRENQGTRVVIELSLA